METDATWKLRIADFYEQWEMHFETEVLPIKLRAWCEPAFIAQALPRTSVFSGRLFEVSYD